MTTPAPQPRPPAGTAAPRAAARPARVFAPPGRVGILADRVLIHARPRGITALLPVIDARHSGLIVCGAKPERAVSRCRDAGFAGIVAIDPAAYKEAATAEEPFTLSPDGQLFEPSLEQVLDDQRAAGADVALTPTRFFYPGERDALKAAARIAASLNRDDTVFSVPLHIAWLNSTYVSQLIAVLQKVPLPKGIFLGSQLDPLDNVAEAAPNLRRLCREVRHLAVLRTDFAAFDVTAHGAFAASLGTGGSLRHIIRPDEKAFSPRPDDPSPTVLVPDLMHFYKGSTLATLYANRSAPRCLCKVCHGRHIDTFIGADDRADAHLHSIQAWMEWLPDHFDDPTVPGRAALWQARCKAAVGNHDIYNTQLRVRNAFKPTNPLRIWAGDFE